MKDFFKFAAAIIASFILGAYLHRRQSPPQTAEPYEAMRDTITVYDTIPYVAPISDTTMALCTQTFRLPVSKQGAGAGGLSKCTENKENTEETNRNTTHLYGLSAGGAPRLCSEDSAAVEIPITQKHYRDSTYEAWVSGFAQNLDSIRVFARTNTITIREYKPPNRWHVGITAGYGYTPGGFKPCIGIGVTYSIFSF